MNQSLIQSYVSKLKSLDDIETVFKEAISNEKLFVFGELLEKAQSLVKECFLFLNFLFLAQPHKNSSRVAFGIAQWSYLRMGQKRLSGIMTKTSSETIMSKRNYKCYHYLRCAQK
jgi:hypothetical protein